MAAGVCVSVCVWWGAERVDVCLGNVRLYSRDLRVRQKCAELKFSGGGFCFFVFFLKAHSCQFVVQLSVTLKTKRGVERTHTPPHTHTPVLRRQEGPPTESLVSHVGACSCAAVNISALTPSV